MIAVGKGEVLHGDGSLSSGVLARFSDRDTALGWYNSPEYQQLMGVRNVAMDVRFRLLDGLLAPTSTDEKKESE